MDERMMMNGGMYNMDGRNPYGSQGGYVMNTRGGDRGYYRRMRRNARRDMARSRSGMNRDVMGGDMRGNDYAGQDMRSNDMRMDGHYPMQGHSGQGSTYYPIQAMGTFEGYYGMPNQQDHARGRDMCDYDMRGGRNNDYGYPMRMPFQNYPPYDYGYPVGDFGETLSESEMEEFKHKLMSQLDDQERQLFSHEVLMQKIKQLGRPMEGFGEKELCVAALMVYTDYKQDIGKNPDMAVRLAYDWLADKDVAVKGAEKLATYYDEIVKGGKDD